MSYQELKKRAIRFRNKKEYGEAVQAYAQICEQYQKECDKWDRWGYAFCLKQLKEYEKCILVCKQSLPLTNNFNMIRNILAWCLYLTTDFRSLKPLDIPEFIEEIIDICENDFEYSPVIKTILKGCMRLKENNLYYSILDYLRILPPDKLSRKRFSFRSKKGRKVTLPSENEQYLNLMTEALVKTNQYHDCLEFCEKGLRQLDVNDSTAGNTGFWIKRRKGLCLQKLGKYDEALKTLKQLIVIKKEWFLFHDIAETYYLMNEVDEALHFTAKAITATGDINMKVKLLEFAGDLLVKTGSVKEAKMNYMLAFKIRESNGWGISSELLNKTGRGNGNVDCHKLKRDIYSFWDNSIAENMPAYTGSIVKILPNNKAGFIYSKNNGENYYFNISRNNLPLEKIETGMSVTFSLEESFDKKKNRLSKEAINILIQE